METVLKATIDAAVVTEAIKTAEFERIDVHQLTIESAQTRGFLTKTAPSIAAFRIMLSWCGNHPNDMFLTFAGTKKGP